MQLDIAISGQLDPHRLHDAVQKVVNRHPNLAARFTEKFDGPCRSSPPILWRPGGTSNSTATASTSKSSMFAPPNVLRCTTSPASRRFGRVDPHRGGPASVVLTAHHIVMDGWSLPVVLRELFAAITGSGCRHPRRIAALSLGWPIVTLTPRARRGVRCSTVSTTPRWWARRPVGPGGEACLGEGARTDHPRG
ncbi:condensation domain protein [Mycobacterium xenopi 4042]|uniref:Condensation domain protein n=1 Tax=Mycobacterium xenopi 4042 TaxID=1299334 RepID=X8DJ21_MYCXE|nr:condensation domain protein [Mycobacterium xenopi 4042]